MGSYYQMFVMKKLLLLSFLVAGSVLVNEAKAQLRISVNIGSQPAWGPGGYDYAEYYYLPDIEAYYCVPTQQFTYYDGGRWITGGLPRRYSNYDLYGGYKVVINERNPWSHFNDHRSRYAGYRARHDQAVIRDYRGRNDNGRYYDNKGWHRGWDNDHGRGNGRDQGRGNGNGNGRGHDKDRGRGHDRDNGRW